MGEPDPLDGRATGGWYRRTIGRRIEAGANRAFGVLFVLIGAFAVALDDAWPARIFAIVMWGFGWLCFRARRSVIEEFGEEPSGGARSRRRNRAVKRP